MKTMTEKVRKKEIIIPGIIKATAPEKMAAPIAIDIQASGQKFFKENLSDSLSFDLFLKE
jgi:uncharacterized protein (UPF0303 family)